MPIRFRCTQCQQLLSVSRRQAGAEVSCPACGGALRVPTLEGWSSERSPADPPRENISAADPLPETGRPSALPSETAPVGMASDVTTAPTEQRSPAGEDHSTWDAELGAWEEHPAFQRVHRTIKDEADMTSMVDVTFLLLVFFMITASFSVTKALQSQPPAAEEGAASAAPAPVTMDDLAAESVVVEIGADDSITVDDVPVAGPVELADILGAKIANEGKTEMVIEAEYRATHGIVVAVTDVGIQAGMQRVRRISRPQQP